MSITIHISEDVEKKLQILAATSGCVDVSTYVQNLLIDKVQSLPPVPRLKEEFERLAEQWRRDTKYLSTAKRMAEHPAYRQIVALGHAIVPLILADLERTGDHWFSALRDITGANPVPEASRGRISEMAQAWLKWGRAQGYQW